MNFLGLVIILLALVFFMICLTLLVIVSMIGVTDGSTQAIIEWLGKKPKAKRYTLSGPYPDNQPPVDDFFERFLSPRVVQGWYISIPGLHQKVAVINVTPQICQFRSNTIEINSPTKGEKGAIIISVQVSYQVVNVIKAFYDTTFNPFNGAGKSKDDSQKKELGNVGYRDELEIKIAASLLETVVSRDLTVEEGFALPAEPGFMDDLKSKIQDSIDFVGICVREVKVTDVQPSTAIAKAREEQFIAKQEAAVKAILSSGIAQSIQALVDQGMNRTQAEQAVLTLEALKNAQGVGLNITNIGGNILEAIQKLTS